MYCIVQIWILYFSKTFLNNVTFYERPLPLTEYFKQLLYCEQIHKQPMRSLIKTIIIVLLKCNSSMLNLLSLDTSGLRWFY